jgi:hypothetical protein
MTLFRSPLAAGWILFFTSMGMVALIGILPSTSLDATTATVIAGVAIIFAEGLFVAAGALLSEPLGKRLGPALMRFSRRSRARFARSPRACYEQEPAPNRRRLPGVAPDLERR